MKLVVGLGNPGPRYADTRHNIGFAVLEELVHRTRGRMKKPFFGNARIAEVRMANEPVLLVRPETYMNRSGEAVAPLMRKKRLSPQDILIVFDDADLACGRIRIRKKGGAGGHNGLQSVLEAVGTDGIPRLRVGVGPRPGGDELIDYVLSPFSEEERPLMADAVKRSAEAVECAVRRGVSAAMNAYNGN